MVVYYSTPDEVRRQLAESKRDYERVRKARANFWRDFVAHMRRARAKVERRNIQMACHYGWKQKAISEATEEIKRLRKIQETDDAKTQVEAHNTEGSSEPLQCLIEAIGRHPLAEADADVADAINAIDDALYQRSE